jgi:23S rRNA (pseudouridine1915-N3)-methyltransferase
MRIFLIQIDKTQDSYVAEGIELYTKRLNNYARFDTLTINVPKAIRQRSVAEQKLEESKLIFKEVAAEDHLVILDEKGKEFTSQEFAKYLMKKQNESLKRLVFLIGGPYGFDETIYKRANFQLSLSKMTFSHQMIRLFFTEQLYRAYTIIKGEKYHHE